MSIFRESVPHLANTLFNLGRHVVHDDASWGFPAARGVVKSVQWTHHGPVLDQKALGCCTGNAMTQWLMTEPAYVVGRELDELKAVEIYSLATQIDGINGVYPPTDTGSSGLAVAKVAKREGYIKAYHHAFGLQHLLEALSISPVLLGIPWYNDMFNPDPTTGLVYPTGQLAGGHEVCVIGNDVDNKMVTILNSWSSSWGLAGTFKLLWSDLDILLRQRGDCTVPVV